MHKIILDTDIGTDVDDALALAYLLAHPECDLLGITTVTGEPEQRAKLASVLCKLAHQQVPIYPGTANPLIIPQLQTKAQQATALPNWPHDTTFPTGQVIDFLRRTIRENPGEVTLLTIGPLTNIGLLFTVDPEIPTLLKGIVTMAGNFLGKIENAPNPEWNAMGDAHASRIVYDQAIKQHRSIGLDVTMQVTMTIPEFRAAFDNDRTRPLLDFAEIWFHEWPVVTFHDPLAAATIFKPELCEYEKGEVLIEINDPENCGWTHWQPNANGRHEIATTVNRDSFIAHYFSILENF